MQVIFNQPRLLGSKLYQKSPKAQEVPDEFVDDWFFQALQKAGEAVVVPKAEPGKKVVIPSQSLKKG